MKIVVKENQFCIDCYKGIVYQLLDMSSGFCKQFDELCVSVSMYNDGDMFYLLDIKLIYVVKGDKELVGLLLFVFEVKVFKWDGDWL